MLAAGWSVPSSSASLLAPWHLRAAVVALTRGYRWLHVGGAAPSTQVPERYPFVERSNRQGHVGSEALPGFVDLIG
jgi:hypothetical protein